LNGEEGFMERSAAGGLKSAAGGMLSFRLGMKRIDMESCRRACFGAIRGARDGRGDHEIKRQVRAFGGCLGTERR